MAKQLFEMTEADYKTLIESCKPVPMIALQCGPVSSPQENANRAWKSLGARMGFDGMSVEPSDKGNRFFLAEPNPKIIYRDVFIEPQLQEDGSRPLICHTGIRRFVPGLYGTRELAKAAVDAEMKSRSDGQSG